MNYYMQSIHFKVSKTVRWVKESAKTSLNGRKFFASGWTVRIPNRIS